MLRDKKQRWAESGQGIAAASCPEDAARPRLTSRRRREPADILGQVLMFGKVETPGTAFAACDPLDIAGNGWGIRPHHQLSPHGAGRDRVLGTASAKVLLAECAQGCEQTQGQARNIPHAEARLKQNKHFSPTSPGRIGGLLSVPPKRALTAPPTCNTSTGLKQNSRATRSAADQRGASLQAVPRRERTLSFRG